MIARPQGTLVSQFRYDPVGRLLSQTAGDGSSSVIARKCQCDEVVNLVSIDNRRNGLTCYSYDSIGRIWSAVAVSVRLRPEPAPSGRRTASG